jgi:general secretion pathway protein D
MLASSMSFRSRFPRAAMVAIISLGLLGCAARQARDTARTQLEAGQYESAVRGLDQAIRQHPDDPELRSAWMRSRNEAQMRLQAQAAVARAQSQWNEAEKHLLRAAALDPDSARVRDLLQALDIERRQATALTQAEALLAKGQAASALRVTVEGLKPNPRHAGLAALQRKLELQEREKQLTASRGGLAEARPISLDFRDTPIRTVLDLVSRHSGVNFVFDKDIRQDLRVSVCLRQVRVEEALDLLVSTHQLAKKTLDGRTVLVYPNTPDKQREYQEQVVKVFYLSNGDVKQAAAMLRNALKVRDPFVDERSNMLLLRESPDTIAIAERLVALYDAAEPEVTLELEVLEISSNRLTELGIKFPDTIGLTPLSVSGANGHTLSSLRELNSDRIGVTVPGLLLNLRREVGDFETLANPRVRIKNREKGKVLIGTKVPVVTTTATTGFIAENVTYLDVGLKLDVEPTVTADDDVSIKVALEVSTLSNQIKTSNGTLAYQIGTRNASTVLRLRDGETQVLAGLVSREERSSASRVPGLGDVPVLGRLFSSQLDNGSRSELVLAITPRVVRNIRRPDATESELWIGTEAYTRLRPPGGRVTSLEPEAAPAGAPGAAPAALGGPAGASAGDAGAQPPAAAAVPSWTLQWKAPATVKPGEEFTAELVGKTSTPVRGVNLRLSARPEQATLLKGTEGVWWKSGNGDQSDVNATQAKDDKVNEWQLGVIRRLAEGVSGEGVLAVLRLKAGPAGRIEWPLLRADAIAAGPVVPKVLELPALKVDVRP